MKSPLILAIFGGILLTGCQHPSKSIEPRQSAPPGNAGTRITIQHKHGTNADTQEVSIRQKHQRASDSALTSNRIFEWRSDPGAFDGAGYFVTLPIGGKCNLDWKIKDGLGETLPPRESGQPPNQLRTFRSVPDPKATDVRVLRLELNTTCPAPLGIPYQLLISKRLPKLQEPLEWPFLLDCTNLTSTGVWCNDAVIGSVTWDGVEVSRTNSLPVVR